MAQLRSATKRTLIALAVLVCVAPSVVGFVFVASDFGLRAASGLFLLFLLPPLVIAIRLRWRWPTVRGREVAYLAVLFCVAVGAMVFVVRGWYDTGMDQRHAEDVRWAEFGRLMRRDPAFRNVEITLTHRKHIYYVEGTVASQADLDRLKSLALSCGIKRERLDGPYTNSVSIHMLDGGSR
jgi:hypothetical protein